MKRAIVIFKKEMLDTLRDRKAIFFMFIFPILLFPLIIGITTKIQMNVRQNEQEKTLTLAFIENSNDHILKELFYTDSSLTILYNISVNSADSLIKLDSLDAAVIIEENFKDNIHNNTTGKIQLHFQTEDDLEIAINRIKAKIHTYSDQILSDRLSNLNLDKEIFTPIEIIEVDLASSREKLGKTLYTSPSSTSQSLASEWSYPVSAV